MRAVVRGKKGVTLIELLVVISVIALLALVGYPEINRFNANYQARSAATDLVQNMKLARAMAIKENRAYLVVLDPVNRRYLVGFDGDNDNNLLTLNFDTFGICKDTNGDRLPEGDVLVNGVPGCVKAMNFNRYGNNVIIGYGAGTVPPNGPNGDPIPVTGMNLTTNGVATTWARFITDGSFGTTGSVYFQHTGRGYSYAVVIRSTTGAMSLWRWNGDADRPGDATWTELR